MSPRVPPTLEEEADSTAELPIPELAGGAPNAAPVDDTFHTRTDTWVLPQANPAGGEQLRELEARLQSLSANQHTLAEQLRETRDMLASKNERLLQVEAARDEAQAAHVDAERRLGALTRELGELKAAAAPADAAQQLQQLSGELAQQRSALGRQADELASAQAARAAAEQRLHSLAVELEQQRAAAGAQGTQLDAEARTRAASEQRVADLEAQLAQLRAAHGAQQQQLQEQGRAHAEIERRAALGAAELGQLRTRLAQAEGQGAELQRTLSQQQSDSHAQRGQDLQRHQAQTALGQAHAEQIAQQLTEERDRGARYLESLQTLEGRRRIAEELVTDLHREDVVRAGELARTQADLGERERQLQERTRELGEKVTRIAQLEHQLATLTATLMQRDEQLRAAQRDLQGLQASVTRLQGELRSSGERARSLEGEAQQRQQGDAQQQSELQRLRSERAALDGALETARNAAADALAQSAAHDAALAREKTRATQAESALGSERSRVSELQEELGTLRNEMDNWGDVLRSAQGHLASIAAAEARVRALESELSQQREAHRRLQVQAESHAVRVLELQTDLQSSAAQVARLEDEARRQGRAHVPTVSTEAAHGSTDTAANPALLEATRMLSEPPAAERDEELADGEAQLDSGDELAPATADGGVRLLIYSADGQEVAHVLGRKTSIGRTPDNDLQLDTKFVSRHHAVILAGPEQTIIEDLNSTNGVLVNGRRVTRHTLREGDHIAIGRAKYRFAVRHEDGQR
jgi:chromosome segregation ATPase